MTGEKNRSRDIIVFGVPEEDNEVIELKVVDIIWFQKPTRCCWIGQRKPSTISSVCRAGAQRNPKGDCGLQKHLSMPADGTIGKRNNPRKRVEQLKQQN